MDQILEVTMFHGIYRNRRVLVTGHTGFKGSWLCLWLKHLGAELCGAALLPDTDPAHWNLLHLDMRSEICDVRDREKLQAVFADFQPEIVFHLAAQPLVRRSYLHPEETFAVNVMGSVEVLEACRSTPSVRAAVMVTSDKCYENVEQLQGYRETDPMGGYDPYSASKGCAELVTAAYRRSFFNPEDAGGMVRCLIASARAGNVTGGGDWASDRLIPDLVKAAASGQVSRIRSPESTRPWQHVLEPLSGYLLLGEKLLEGGSLFAGSWNFGPEEDGVRTVEEMASVLARYWRDVRFEVNPPEEQPHEAGFLRLDCTKARESLNWHGVWTPEENMEKTAEWYKAFYRKGEVRTLAHLDAYIRCAVERGLEWTK